MKEIPLLILAFMASITIYAILSQEQKMVNQPKYVELPEEISEAVKGDTLFFDTQDNTVTYYFHYQEGVDGFLIVK